MRAAGKMPREVVEAVMERAGYSCECCHQTITGKGDLHHRKSLKHGGRHTVENLLLLDHDHHMAAHFRWNALAVDRGIIVRSWSDETSIPVLVTRWPWA